MRIRCSQLQDWIRHCGRPLHNRSDPKSNYRPNITQKWGDVEATVDLVKTAA